MLTMSSQDSGTPSCTLQEVPLDEGINEEKEQNTEGLQHEVSSDSEDAMYSVGSTPAGTPVKVPKGETLTKDDCHLLIQMESQNEYLSMKETLESRIQT